jgi:hypothetical protein
MHVKFLVAACAAAACTTAIAAGPFDQFKGKIKPGQYEVKMDMDMPGMPGNMGKQSMTMKNCVTDKDIENGRMGKDNKMADTCEVKNFKMSGNTATYTAACKEPQMTSDTTITFRDDGYTMSSKTSMVQGGQTMQMTHKMDGRYIGPCTK